MDSSAELRLPSQWEGFEPWSENARGETLAVIVHGLGLSSGQIQLPTGATRDSMSDAIDLAKDAFANGGVDIYAPTMPYFKWRDGTGAAAIVQMIADDLDHLWRTRGGYSRIVFVGHSMGGVLLRRVFLHGASRSPDFAGNDRDDIPGVPRDWSKKVERLVLIGTWDKGWSVSDRDSWWAAIGLNLLGFWSRAVRFLGQLGPQKVDADKGFIRKFIDKASNIGRTMFDMRRGSTFIVQTRLKWMAYRRWFDEEAIKQYNKIQAVSGRELKRAPDEENNPLVVQLIGTTDDFVSPLDQVDNDVDGRFEEDAEKRKFFLLEMPATDHTEAIRFSRTEDAERKKAFLTALIGDKSEPTEFVTKEETTKIPPLKDMAKNPVFFEDNPMEPKHDVENVVFIIHGIRDNGYWTHRIAKAIKEVDAERRSPAPPQLVTCTPTYGYFPMGEFLLPWIRQQKTEWFMDLYVNMKARYPNARLHYVGHSNGTYLAANALEKYPAARFANIYFAGSVVNQNFEWTKHLNRGAIERFHNARGATDWVVALLPKSVDYFSDLGGGGFDGFKEITAPGHDPRLTQSEYFALGGHSGAIQEAHWGEIGNFIVNDLKPGEDRRLFVKAPYRFLSVLSDLRIGIPAGLLFGLILILSPASIAVAIDCLTEFFATFAHLVLSIVIAPFALLARAFPFSWHWLSYVLLAFAVVILTGVLGRFVKWVDEKYSAFLAWARAKTSRDLSWIRIVEVKPIHILVGGFLVTVATLSPLIAHEAQLIQEGSKTFAVGSALTLAGAMAFVSFVLTRF